MKKKLIIWITIAVLVVGAAVGTGIGIGSKGCYKPDHGYTAVDPGELPAPREGFDYEKASLEKYSQPITITVGAIDYPLDEGVKPGTTPLNQSFNRLVEEVLNIKLKYVVVGSSDNYDQKLTLAISSNNTPDMFYTTNSSLYADLKDSGKLADLGDVFYYLNKELQDIYLKSMPELLPNVMEEGKLYAFPMASNKYESAQKLYIRKDWLDIVDADAPETMDELMALGETFVANKDKILSQTGLASGSAFIPLAFHKDVMWTGTASASGLMQAHGASPNSYFLGEDGKLYASNTSQEMKNALKTMNEMYSKKIIDQEFAVKNVDMVYDNIKSGSVGMVFGQWWLPHGEINSTITNVTGADWVAVDLPDYNGQDSLPIVKRVNLTGYNLVSSSCKYPEACAKIINLFYDVYYNDNAEEIYGPDVKPENGFFYNMVPIKLWNSIASIQEYKRVNAVFKEAYELGMRVEYDNSGNMSASSWNVLSDEAVGLLGEQQRSDYLAQLAVYNKLKTREKELHWRDGYPYYCALMAGKNIRDMNAKERLGWGIYNCMIDDNCGYKQVTDLTEGKLNARYDEFYGSATSAMVEYSGYIDTTLSATVYAQIIKGEKPLSYFDEYVKEYNNNGGTTIIKQVNEWYNAQWKGDSSK